MISGFRCDVDEICTLLGYYAVVSGYWRFGTTYCPIFKGQEVQVLDFLTLEDGTDTLSWNFGKVLLLDTA
jgi:hypothetical protein